MRRELSVIQPEAPGTNPLNYPRLIQPVLDKHCVECHEKEAAADKTFRLNGGGGSSGLSPESFEHPGELFKLEGGEASYFSESFANLRPYTFYFKDGAWTVPRTKPGKFGSYASKLYKTLTSSHHGVKLTPEELSRFTVWMDNNCDFFGAYENLQPQREGKIVQPSLE